jgi:hypothetical protein
LKEKELGKYDPIKQGEQLIIRNREETDEILKKECMVRMFNEN